MSDMISGNARVVDVVEWDGRRNQSRKSPARGAWHQHFYNRECANARGWAGSMISLGAWQALEVPVWEGCRSVISSMSPCSPRKRLLYVMSWLSTTFCQ